MIYIFQVPSCFACFVAFGTDFVDCTVIDNNLHDAHCVQAVPELHPTLMHSTQTLNTLHTLQIWILSCCKGQGSWLSSNGSSLDTQAGW